MEEPADHVSSVLLQQSRSALTITPSQQQNEIDQAYNDDLAEMLEVIKMFGYEQFIHSIEYFSYLCTMFDLISFLSSPKQSFQITTVMVKPEVMLMLTWTNHHMQECQVKDKNYFNLLV